MARFTTTDDVTIDYNIYGQGQSMILVAGYSGNQATWTAQVDVLVASGLQVITYDRRNHGKSETVNYGMRLSRHGKDLAELISVLQLKKPILLGHSMGASTIWAYLSLFSDKNVRAVITEDQVPTMLHDDTWPFGLFHADMGTIMLAIKKLPHTKLTRLKISNDIKRAIGENYQPFDFQFNMPLLLNSAVQDWRDVLRRERVPHLYLAGDESPLWPAKHSELAANMTENGQYIIFDGAGHIPHIEVPEMFNQVVLEFINQL